MKSTNLLIVLCVTLKLVLGYQDILYRGADSCKFYRNVVQDYRVSLYEFSVQVYKVVGEVSLYHFVFSPLSTWIILAAIAEGADPNTQQELFRFLRLPNEPCVRLKYYELATSRYLPGSDINIEIIRSLFINEGSTVNPYWHHFVSQNSLIDIKTVPIRYDPRRTLETIRRITSAQLPGLDLTGNSVLVDALDFNGLWTTAFSDAIIQRSPFYNRSGIQIGAVDLMRVKRRARMSFLPKLNAKVLELPIGINDRYRMIFAVILDDSNLENKVKDIENTVVFEFLNSARVSSVPIDIAIPRFTLTSEVNVRTILENLGVTSLWRDPTVTRYISNPPAFPSGFVQRATITLDNHGVNPEPYTFEPHRNITTGLDPILGTDFVANQPFFFTLFDTETFTCIMAAIYSQPSYTN